MQTYRMCLRHRRMRLANPSSALTPFPSPTYSTPPVSRLRTTVTYFSSDFAWWNTHVSSMPNAVTLFSETFT